MVNINYSYDGKGKYQSCELNLNIESELMYSNNSIELGAYGADLSEALNNLVKDLMNLKYEVDHVVENILEKQINLIDTQNDNNILVEERLTNYYSGEHYTKPILPSINSAIDNFYINNIGEV